MAFNAIKIRKYPELDTLRFVSVTLVIGHHLFLQSNSFLNLFYLHGYVGVDIFFTLSGFIITLSLLKEYEHNHSINFKNFIIRRMLRLWPSWLLTLILSTGLVWYMGLRNSEIKQELLSKGWHYFLHFGNYSHAFLGKLHTLFSHFWSLAVEEHFYLIWPSLLLISIRNKFLTVFSFSTMLIMPYFFRVYHKFETGNNFISTLSTHTRFDALAYGCLLAVIFPKLPTIKKKSSQTYAWLLCLFLFYMGLHLKHTQISPWLDQFGYSLRSIASAWLIYLLLKTPKEGFRKFWSYQILAKLGVLSYGAYLYHFILNTVIFKVNLKFPINETIIFFLATTMIYIPSYLSYLAIDLKIEKIKAKFY